jgi:hypothetical protein
MQVDRQADSQIVDESDRPAGSHRVRTRSIIVGLVLVLAGGLVVEQVGAAPGRTSRPSTGFSSFEPRLAPAAPAASTGSGTTPTGDAAVAALNQRADDAIARIAAATAGRASGGGSTSGSGTAAITPSAAARVCPILLEEGAELIAQTDRLIAASPSQAARLIAVRDRGIAALNVKLVRYGCPISFG